MDGARFTPLSHPLVGSMCPRGMILGMMLVLCVHVAWSWGWCTVEHRPLATIRLRACVSQRLGYYHEVKLKTCHISKLVLGYVMLLPKLVLLTISSLIEVRWKAKIGIRFLVVTTSVTVQYPQLLEPGQVDMHTWNMRSSSMPSVVQRKLRASWWYGYICYIHHSVKR